MRKIRIAQIGINRYSHGPELFSTLKSHPELFDLVGYVLVEDERETCAVNLEKYYAGYPELSLQEVLEDPTIEAVTVETDEIHLLKYARMAAEHGKHIHMEKPGSQSLEDFEALIETMRKTGKVFHMGYMFRYHPLIADAIQRVKSGEFGHIYSVEAHMSRYDDRKCREWLGEFKGGMMFYLGSNLIDVVLQLQGMPDRVIPMNTKTAIGDVYTEDFGFAVLQYPSAASFVRASGVELGGNLRRQIVICGEKKTLEIRPIEIPYPTPTWQSMYYSESDETFLNENRRTVREHRVSEPFQRYFAMISAFAAMVRGEKENPYTLEYELALFRTIMKCCGADIND